MDSSRNILETIAFLDPFATGLLASQIPPQARSLGFNHSLIGSMIAVFAGVQLFSSPLTRSLCELKGSKNTLFLLMLLSGIVYFFLGTTSSITAFFALRISLGLFKKTDELITSLAAVKQTPSVLERVITKRKAGMILGPIVGGHIMYWYPENGFTIIGVIVAAVYAWGSGLSMNVPNEDKKRDKTKDDSINAIASRMDELLHSGVKDSIEQFNKIDWNVHGRNLLFKFLLSLAISIFCANFPLYMKIKFQASPVTLGYVTSILITSGLCSSYYIPVIDNFYSEDKEFDVRIRHVFIFTTVGLFALSISPNLSMYIVSFLIFSVCISFANNICSKLLLSNANESDKGIVSNVAEYLQIMAGIFAPLIVGTLSDTVGVLYVIYLAILISAYGTYKCYEVDNAKNEIDKKEE